MVGFIIGLFYFVFGKSLKIEEIFLKGQIVTTADLIVATLLIAVGFGTLYTVIKKIYRSQHGLEDAEAAQRLFHTKWRTHILKAIGVLLYGLWVCT
jgi:hypothetical protein